MCCVWWWSRVPAPGASTACQHLVQSRSLWTAEFVLEAVRKAKEALENGEVPVGCLMVYNNEILAKGRNEVNQTKNCIPGYHAEEAVEMLKTFYKQENPNAPKSKVRKKEGHKC